MYGVYWLAEINRMVCHRLSYHGSPKTNYDILQHVILYISLVYFITLRMCIGLRRALYLIIH